MMVPVEHNGSALKITFVGDNGFRDSALSTNRTLNSNTSLSVSLEIAFLIDGLNSKDLRAVQYHPIYVVVMSTDHNTDEHAYLDLVHTKSWGPTRSAVQATLAIISSSHVAKNIK